MSIIRATRLSRRYGRRVGIDNVNLEIGEGETFGFLGPNGAGKTTAIRVLLGFLRPSGGSASILGRDCWRQSCQIKRDIGYLPGDLRLYSWMTGTTALAIIGKIRGLDLRAEGAALAERFGLEMNVGVRRMSKGMRQKLGLILALAHRPRLLILDEPTSGLDPLMQDELARCLRERALAGATVFFSSHTLGEVENLCDRVAVVRQGRIIADESLHSLRARARRTVKILFADRETAEQAVLPAFIKLERRDGALCVGELEGPTPPLLHWAAQQAIDDFSVSPPDLESVFRNYYRTPEPST